MPKKNIPLGLYVFYARDGRSPDFLSDYVSHHIDENEDVPPPRRATKNIARKRVEKVVEPENKRSVVSDPVRTVTEAEEERPVPKKKSKILRKVWFSKKRRHYGPVSKRIRG